MGQDFWVVKVAANGDMVWNRTFGGHDEEECYSARETADGGFVLAGLSWSFESGDEDYWLVRANADGDSLWSRNFDHGSDDVCRSVLQTADHGYLLGGWDNQWSCMWIVKTAPELSSLDVFPLPPSSFTLSAYPNPFNATTRIRLDLPHTAFVNLDVYDVTGRLVENLASRVFDAGNHHLAFDGTDRASGIYIVRMTSPENSLARKIVLAK